jgi:hypothetical protein
MELVWEDKLDAYRNHRVQSVKIVNSFKNFSGKNLYLWNDLTHEPDEVEIEG